MLEKLPENLPAPEDNGECDHLEGFKIPEIHLMCTNGSLIDLAFKNTTVLYCYPMTGRPDVKLPSGWEEIPGARGCTPQSCAFRDINAELKELGSDLYGLSVQDTDYQLEAKNRLGLNFELISDKEFAFSKALKLPFLEVEELVLIKRLTLIIENGIIKKCFYPVFPPDKNPRSVLNWLKSNVRG